MPVAKHILLVLVLGLFLAMPVTAQQEDAFDTPILEVELDIALANAASVRPDGTQLVIVGDPDLIVLDLETGEEIARTTAPGGLFLRTAWTEDGAYMAVWQEGLGDDPVNTIQAVYDTTDWTEAEVNPTTLDWRFEGPTQTFQRAGMSADNSSGPLEDGTTLMLGAPVTITGARSIVLGNADAGADWYAEPDIVTHWSMAGDAEVWDLASGERLARVIHYAENAFTGDGTPFAPHLAGDNHLVTFSYGGFNLYVGATASVYVEDDGLSMRSAPSINGDLIERLPRGTEVTLTGLPIEADGYRWWPLLAPSGNTGWSVEGADSIVTLRPLSWTPFDGTMTVRVYALSTED